MEADTGHQVTTATSYRGDDIEADTGHGWRASKGMTSTPREPPRILEATEPITTATSCQGNDIDTEPVTEATSCALLSLPYSLPFADRASNRGRPMEADTGHQVTEATSYRGNDIEADTGHVESQ